MELRPLNSVILNFNKTINKLLNLLSGKSKSDIEVANLDRLKKRVNMLVSASESLLIERASPIFIDISEPILNKDEEFFMNTNVKEELKNNGFTLDKQDEYLFSLIDSIRKIYKNAPKNDKDIVFNHIKNLFDDCVEYQYHHTK